MSWETGIVARLKADLTVAGLVGAKVFPERATQGSALPYLTYQVISDPPIGRSYSGGHPLAEALFQVECWAATYAETIALGRAVQSSLSGAFGDFGGDEVCLVTVADRRDLSETAGDDRVTRRRQIDFNVMRKETVA